MITENLGKVHTAKKYDFDYVVSKNEDGNYQAVVIDNPDIVLSFRFDESDEVHRSMCEASMYYAIRDYKGKKEHAKTYES